MLRLRRRPSTRRRPAPSTRGRSSSRSCRTRSPRGSALSAVTTALDCAFGFLLASKSTVDRSQSFREPSSRLRLFGNQPRIVVPDVPHAATDVARRPDRYGWNENLEQRFRLALPRLDPCVCPVDVEHDGHSRIVSRRRRSRTGAVAAPLDTAATSRRLDSRVNVESFVAIGPCDHQLDESPTELADRSLVVVHGGEHRLVGATLSWAKMPSRRSACRSPRRSSPASAFVRICRTYRRDSASYRGLSSRMAQPIDVIASRHSRRE